MDGHIMEEMIGGFRDKSMLGLKSSKLCSYNNKITNLTSTTPSHPLFEKQEEVKDDMDKMEKNRESARNSRLRKKVYYQVLFLLSY